MLKISTVKFDYQDELDDLQARIYLDTKKKLTKKEILGLFFKYGTKHYNEIIKDLQKEQLLLTKEEIDKLLSLSYDWGPGTENSSQTVDETIYSNIKNNEKENKYS